MKKPKIPKKTRTVSVVFPLETARDLERAGMAEQRKLGPLIRKVSMDWLAAQRKRTGGVSGD